jgi:GNAT superfamily N-acetyltransferase
MSNDEPVISMETLSDELIAFYQGSEMDRGLAGKAAIEWTFAGNRAPFCIARREERIVGLSAYMQGRMKFGTQTGTAFQAIDSFVAPEMRGKGMFTLLARAYAEHAADTEADLVWGFPNDNAAPAWFGKLGWVNHGQVPFMIKPLRAGYFLRKLKLFGDFPLGFSRDQNLQPIDSIGDWADELWRNFSSEIGCAIVRDRAFLQHRLFSGPAAQGYRVVADTGKGGALVATHEAEKHGGRIAYLMEAMGDDCLKGMLDSELARLRNRGVELVLAWCYPWSPNYRQLRACGFLPFPERIRPTRIWFGGRASSALGKLAETKSNWYLSYLDSDTV